MNWWHGLLVLTFIGLTSGCVPDSQEPDEPEEPVPTAMEAALREAMEKSQNGEEKSPAKKKKPSVTNNELENIFSRTLNQNK